MRLAGRHWPAGVCQMTARSRARAGCWLASQVLRLPLPRPAPGCAAVTPFPRRPCRPPDGACQPPAHARHQLQSPGRLARQRPVGGLHRGAQRADHGDGHALLPHLQGRRGRASVRARFGPGCSGTQMAGARQPALQFRYGAASRPTAWRTPWNLAVFLRHSRILSFASGTTTLLGWRNRAASACTEALLPTAAAPKGDAEAMCVSSADAAWKTRG